MQCGRKSLGGGLGSDVVVVLLPRCLSRTACRGTWCCAGGLAGLLCSLFVQRSSESGAVGAVGCGGGGGGWAGAGVGVVGGVFGLGKGLAVWGS